MHDRSILRDAGKLIGSGIFVQAIAFLLIVFVGRLYNDQELGTLGLFLAWGGLLSIISCGRYEHAIVVGHSNRDAEDLFSLSIRLNLVFFFILVPIAFVSNHFIAKTSYSDMEGIVLLIPLFVFCQGLLNALSMLRLQQKGYNRLSISQAVQGISNNLLKVLLGFKSSSVGSLIIATFTSIGLGWLPLFKGSLFRKVEHNRLKEIARRYDKFPKYGIIQALIDNLLGSLFLLMLPLKFSLAEIGIITMAITLARRPMQVVGDNLSRVYYQRLSVLYNSGQRLMPTVMNFVKKWIIFSIPFFLILSFFLPKLVVFIVGHNWADSAFVIAWMLPMFIPNFMNMIFNIIPDILGKQKENMYVQIAMLIVDVLIILSGIFIFDFKEMVRYFYISTFFVQIAFFLFLIKLTIRHDRSI